MHKFRRDVDHKLRVLQHADKIGDVGKACRYFGVGRQLLSLANCLSAARPGEAKWSIMLADNARDQSQDHASSCRLLFRVDQSKTVSVASARLSADLYLCRYVIRPQLELYSDLRLSVAQASG
jgi:hypothetical protein